MSVVSQILVGASIGMGAIGLILLPLIIALLWDRKEKR